MPCVGVLGEAFEGVYAGAGSIGADGLAVGPVSPGVEGVEKVTGDGLLLGEVVVAVHGGSHVGAVDDCLAATFGCERGLQERLPYLGGAVNGGPGKLQGSVRRWTVVGLTPGVAVLDIERGRHQAADEHPVLGTFRHPSQQRPDGGFIDVVYHYRHHRNL